MKKKTLQDATFRSLLGLSLVLAGACNGDDDTSGGATEGTTGTGTTGTTGSTTATTSTTGASTDTTSTNTSTTGPTTATGTDTEGSGSDTGTGDTGTGDTGTGDTGTGDTGTAGSTGGTSGGTGSSTGTTGGTGSTGGTTGGGIPSCEAAFFTDFSTCMDGFSAGKANSDPNVSDPSWACGDPTAGPAGAMGVWATNLDGDYNLDESSYLEAPPIDLSNCVGNKVRIEILHWYRIETGYDGANFQVSTDGGQTWEVVPALGYWYDTNDLDNPDLWTPPGGQPGFTGLDGEWRTSVVDLAPYLGASDVRFRFVFGSDYVVNYEGWYVDQFEIVVE